MIASPFFCVLTEPFQDLSEDVVKDTSTVPFISAVARVRDEKAFDLLLQHKCDVNVVNSAGVSAIWLFDCNVRIHTCSS